MISRWTSHLSSITLYIFLSFALLGKILAQDSSTGAIRGTVTDMQGAAVASADVLAVRVDTGLRYHVLTDVDGRFTIEFLPPGEYMARTEAAGMNPQESPRVRVELGGATELRFKLAVSGGKETVTVSGAPPIVETQPSSVSTMLDERAIADLPLNGRRYTDLSLLAPGVTQDPRGLTSASNGDLAFGGIRGYNSSYLVDGADNNNGFFAQARGRYRAPYQFSNEVVQEFRVSSNTYGAELGRAGGAVVNVVTKSGSNHWHGSGFFYRRDSTFGATPATLGFKPSDKQNQFGGTLGGPIRRNKVFFFAGYDQHIFNVPTIVEFLNGTTVVTPQKGQEPLSHGDYEESDKDLVFAAAASLSTMGGAYRAQLLGNTAFVKLDYSLTPKHFLSTRLNTSRYYGTNNVFFDPSSPVTTYAVSGNGEENVTTESASVGLLSGLTPKITSHLRAQFSRDLQQSFANSTDVRTRIYDIIDAFGQSSILPRQTREYRLHLAETLSVAGGRNDWKFGGDAMFTQDYNYFPSLFGGQYIYDDIKVDPWTFEPMHGGMAVTPLRAWAHNVPRYYVQNFGNPVSHPDSNDFSLFAQDTLRVTRRLALSFGVRYDLQRFAKKGLVSSPLWPASGKMPADTNNVAPRVGFAYSVGDSHPLVVRGGFGIFYTRLPQIYESAVMNDNGVTDTFLKLDNTEFYQHRLFPLAPGRAVDCGQTTQVCLPPDSLKPYVTADVSSFAPNFVTPKVQQGSLNLERELADRFAAGVSYMYVRGENLIRARDVNLPVPTEYNYPIFDAGDAQQEAFYTVASFSTWQMTKSLTCPYPPCLNDISRPTPQLGAINQFESAATSIYHGMTVSLRRRMTHGVYFRLAYTWAHAIDDGQDALVAGRPVTVQNSYSTQGERGSSVTDQRNRLSISWIVEPRPFGRGQEFLATIFNDWKLSGIATYGSGRPANAHVTGDPNQDGNSGNDRLYGYRRNAFLGPDYASMDMRVTRKFRFRERYRIEVSIESFNLFNRDNRRYDLSDDGWQNTAGQFVPLSRRVKGIYYPAYYQQPKSFMKATSAFAPRQVQLSFRFAF